MKALCWHGKNDVRIENVPDPKLKKEDDVIVEVTSTAICGSRGQTHMQHYRKPLLKKIESGEIDPTFVITHNLDLEDAPDAYQIFKDKKEGCVKVVMTP